MTAAAMKNLRAHGCTPENILNTPEEKLKVLIRPVGFYNRKAGFVNPNGQ
jgi:endonuclease III